MGDIRWGQGDAPPPVGEPPDGLRWGPYGVARLTLTLAEAESQYAELVANMDKTWQGGPHAFGRPYQSGESVQIDIYSWGP